MTRPNWRAIRERMVARDVAGRDISDERVLAAMRRVPREKFVPEELRRFAYDDGALPIAEGQTISQPYMVAEMIQAAAVPSNGRVLEVGTGSGYAAAVLAEIAGEVFTIERHGRLADEARRLLDGLGYRNIHVVHGDGTRGLPDQAPFDAILVAAGGPRVPASLKAQLAIGGRLIIPVGVVQGVQTLQRVTRQAEDAFASEDLGTVAFVPLVGDEGWRGGDGGADA